MKSVRRANIVSEFCIGNTRIRIADNYCKKTGAEVEKLLRNIAERAQYHITAAANAAYEKEV